jgi:signal transduction histidine kinase
VPLAALRLSPLAVTAVVTGTLGVWAVTAPGENEGFAPFPSLLVLCFAAGLRIRPPGRSAALATVPLVAMAAALQHGYYADESNPAALVILVFFLGGAWGLGRLVLHRAVALEGEQQRSGERAREAVVLERMRIARELHDVVAHSLSVITVQAGAAEGLLRRDPDRAAQHLHAVRTSAREALLEMRRLVGALREDEQDLAPQPSLARLDELVAAAEVPVELHLPDGLPELPPGLDLAAYRIVQEALTNVRRHAGAVPTQVRVERAGGDLTLEVRNAAGRGPAQDAGGRGLVGMRERVRLYGGELAVGPGPDGGWSVRAVLPVDTG